MIPPQDHGRFCFVTNYLRTFVSQVLPPSGTGASCTSQVRTMVTPWNMPQLSPGSTCLLTCSTYQSLDPPTRNASAVHHNDCGFRPEPQALQLARITGVVR